MKSGNRRLYWGLGVAAAVLVAGSIVFAASKSVNLDGRSANGAESAVSLNILSSFPARVENKVTNRAVGDSYRFTWPSAGPGGFSSQVVAGTTSGVGATWVWQTSQTIYSFTGNSCEKDICFTKVEGPDPAPTNVPAWAVPGRTLTPNAVTVSSGSLTSSLITFFSPPQTLVTATSSIGQLASGQMSFTTTYTNNTPDPVDLDVPPAPPGCCPDPDQLNCEGNCVDYLWDDENCGGCGVNCYDLCGEGGGGYFGEGEYSDYCYYGYCECYGEGEGASRKDEGFPRAARRPGTLAKREAVDVIVGAQALDNVETAPVCETDGFTTTIPPGGSFTQCVASDYLPKEIPGVLTVCGDSIPDGVPTCGGGDAASEGTFMQFVPDLDNPIPADDAYLTPYQVTLTDFNGDGVLQPGETGVLYVSVLNVGTKTYVSPAADLASPPVDLTDDGAANPEAVSITQASSPYAPDVQGIVPAPGGDCDGPFAPALPSTNTVAYVVQVPVGHTEDVIRPFELRFNGLVDGVPRDLTVPFSLGIGSDEPPTVEILQPVSDQLGLPSLNYPTAVRFRTTSAAPIAREVVSLDHCPLWDGLTYGDRDGLLSDETLQINRYLLCQAMSRCGLTVLYYPRIRVTATDVWGRVATDDVILRKYLLKTEACAR